MTVELYQRPLNTHVKSYVLIGHGHFLIKQAAHHSSSHTTSAADNVSFNRVTIQIRTEGFILGLRHCRTLRGEGCYFARFQVSCALLGHYAASSVNLPTFRDYILVPSAGVKNPTVTTIPQTSAVGYKHFRRAYRDREVGPQRRRPSTNTIGATT